MTSLPKDAKNSLPALIDEFIDYMEVEKGASNLTLRNYKHYLSRFNDWMAEHGYKSVKSINPEVLRKYRLYLSRLTVSEDSEKTLARRTQGYHVIAIRSFLRYLVKNDYDVMSPDKIDLPKVSERQVKFLSGEQVERLLNSPSLSSITGKRDKAILEMLYSTGLRVSELVGVDRNKLDLSSREFGVVGKGGKARVVFLSKRSADWIMNYLEARDDPYAPLFIRHKGKVDVTTTDEEMRLSVRSVQRLLKKYSRQARLPIHATPHVLRHSFATDLLMAGADLRSVQEMLGHKNVQTTQIYTHVTNKQLKDIHESFHGKGGK